MVLPPSQNIWRVLIFWSSSHNFDYNFHLAHAYKIIIKTYEIKFLQEKYNDTIDTCPIQVFRYISMVKVMYQRPCKVERTLYFEKEGVASCDTFEVLYWKGGANSLASIF